MGVNSLPKTVTRQRRDCDLNPDPSAPESSTLTARPPSITTAADRTLKICFCVCQLDGTIGLKRGLRRFPY